MGEKRVIGFPNYLVFFDNVRVDKYVKSFSVDLSCDGQIGSASIEMVYIPDLYVAKSKDGNGHVTYPNGINNMTNCKIFIKNMFSEKYVMVFDGNIRGKSLTKTQGNSSITFQAQDYLTWLNKTIVPLAIPLNDSLNAGDKLRWKAQGVNPQDSNIKKITNANDNNFLGEDLSTIVTKILNQTFVANKIYTDPNSVAMWDEALHRVAVMGDIDANLREKKVLDFVVQSSAVEVSSIYVMINDLIKNLLFEFYQDRDGIIRIKPPYWNEKLLKDHIVDPSLIISYSETVNWNNYFTRIVVTGGIEEHEEGYDDNAKGIVTPVVAYALSGDNGISTDFIDDGGGSSGYDTSGWPSAMSLGYTGDSVKSLQQVLTNLGYSPGAVDGIFGPNTQSAVEAFQTAKGLTADGIVGSLTKGAIAGNNPDVSVGNDQFLQPTDVERRNGVSVYEASQPLIKFSNAQTLVQTNTDACGVLKDYAKFMLSLLNSAVVVATMQTVAMPWIRPGFNMWVDPMTQDRVFYVNAVNHQGTADGGVYSSFRLGLGRSSDSFSGYVDTFGAMREGSSTQRDNIFINQIKSEYEPEKFGTTIGTAAEFNAVLKDFQAFYGTNTDDVVYANKSDFYARYYGSANVDSFNYTASASTTSSSSSSSSSSGSDSYGIDSWPGILRNGDSGSSVTSLQNLLNVYGFDCGSADGIFGPMTESAVENFQSSNGCSMVDGIVGPETRSVMKTKEGYSAAVAGTTSSSDVDSWPSLLLNGSTGDSVTQLQNMLLGLGYSEVGSADGSFGSMTESGVEHYQKDHSLSVDGIVGPQTKASLKSSSSSSGSSSSSSSSTTDSFASSKIFGGEYQISDPTAANYLPGLLDSLYASAPDVVKSRSANLKSLMTICETYVKTHYVTEG